MAEIQRRIMRMGIDVGGTHTKAVALDNESHEILGKASVKTTHDDELGVAAGVIEVFKNCLLDHGLNGGDVVFIAHSTTQATNALLEGDVAHVGIIGIGKPGLEGFITKRQTKISDIDLGTGKKISINHAYHSTRGFTEEEAGNVIKKLTDDHAEVIVAVKAFGVDNNTEEKIISDVARSMGLPVTLAADITKMYGLTIRTHTAVVNASILPKMLDTADRTERSVQQSGIKVPLMMMRGDGGVMEISDMKRKPVLTMLSGPAASIMGALMYLRASNGIYFEVGGTSTNIGVIKDGRPALKYSKIGGHSTYINSLDVRVLGVAGGSMVRVNKKSIIDVGPRSAHIAGLPYVAFTPVAEIITPVVEFFKPKPDDPADYVAIRSANGKLFAITNTCAANALGLVKPEHFSYGDQESCRSAIKALADFLGLSLEDTARQILETASSKIVKVINELSAEYKLETDQSVLVGCGGGAAALLPFTAEKMRLPYNIPENAEVISSIGVALAMIREVVERVVPNPKREDINRIKHEAAQRVIDNGAVPESVEVHIEIDTHAQKLMAIATGSSEVQTTDLLKECTLKEAEELAAASFGVIRKEDEKIVLANTNGQMHVFTCKHDKNNMIRVVDKKGFIRIQRRDGFTKNSTVTKIFDDLAQAWEEGSQYNDYMTIPPTIYIIKSGRILDMGGMLYLDHVNDVVHSEVDDEDGSIPLIIVTARNDMGM